MAKKVRGLVGSSCGLTVMLGGFQAVRVDCWLALPATKSKVKRVHRKCVDFVHEKVRDEVKKIYKHNQELKGLVEEPGGVRRTNGEDKEGRQIE